MNNDSATTDLLGRLRQGSHEALAELFSHHRERLRRIVHFRLDYRLKGRISDSDVLQDTYISAAKRMQHYLDKPEMPFFVWLRLLVNQQLVDVHRQHLQAEMRDARKEVSLNAGGRSQHTSLAIAAHIAAQGTSPSKVFEQAERIAKLEQALGDMNEIDREVIALRHFEELTSAETAEVLGIEKSAASKRYVRAIKRLQEIVTAFSSLEKRELQ